MIYLFIILSILLFVSVGRVEVQWSLLCGQGFCCFPKKTFTLTELCFCGMNDSVDTLDIWLCGLSMIDTNGFLISLFFGDIGSIIFH